MLRFSVEAQAERLKLPGRTLGVKTAKMEQPAKNPQNVFGVAVSPPSPYIGQSLRFLLNYSRANHPALYRQALSLRRTGSSQPAVQAWLLDQISLIEGYADPTP